MLPRLDLRGVDDLASALARPEVAADPTDTVRAILTEVRTGGDDALRSLTHRFDHCTIDELRVPDAELDTALDAADPAFVAALTHAASAVRAYHERQLAELPRMETAGIELEERAVPVRRAGCYVPGGRAAYPSTVLMTAIPAQVAGVETVVLCVPPDADGRVAPATLAAARLVGVDAVYRVGGAQAIAAMAYGTETIPAVDVVVGPGNAYVAAAKREVQGVVGIDSFAGPSEVVIVADAAADPRFVAADLMAQAEHGPGGTAVLVTWDASVPDAVDAALDELLATAARADEIVATLATGGSCVLVDGPSEAAAAVDVIAPEHLQLMQTDAEAMVAMVHNAGAVFIGPWAPAAVGDYVAGVNHVLPTARTARFASALRVDTFRKHVHVVRVTEAGLASVADHVDALARAEGLPAHARSVTIRREPSPGGGAR